MLSAKTLMPQYIGAQDRLFSGLQRACMYPPPHVNAPTAAHKGPGPEARLLKVLLRTRLLPARVPSDFPTSMRRSWLPSVHRTGVCAAMAMAARGEKRVKTHTQNKNKRAISLTT